MTTLSPAEARSELVRQFLADCLNGANPETLDALFSADLVEHAGPGAPGDRNTLRAGLLALRTAFPDLRGEEVLQIQEGNVVALRVQWRATHRAAFLGLPATDRQVAVGEHHLFRFQDNLVVEHWSERDTEGLLRQLGVEPAAG